MFINKSDCFRLIIIKGIQMEHILECDVINIDCKIVLIILSQRHATVHATDQDLTWSPEALLLTEIS